MRSKRGRKFNGRHIKVRDASTGKGQAGDENKNKDTKGEDGPKTEWLTASKAFEIFIIMLIYLSLTTQTVQMDNVQGTPAYELNKMVVQISSMFQLGCCLFIVFLYFKFECWKVGPDEKKKKVNQENIV